MKGKFSPALEGKVSWKLVAKKYHKVTLNNKPHLTFTGKDRGERVAAPVQEGSSEELSRTQVYIGVLVGRDFQGGDW